MIPRQETVLVVDDEIASCENLTLFLKHEGFAASYVNSGEDAVRQLQQATADVVLLDIRMPGIDGVETLKRIREKVSDCIVIMITASDDIDTALGAIRAGANDFLRKPVNFLELKHSMESELEKRRLRKENREYQKGLEEKVAEQTKSIRELYLALKKANLEIIRSLAEAIEAKDPYTRGHCNRVTKLSCALGMEIGLSKEDLEILEYGALLHDIGKIGVNEAILHKPSKLSEEEYKEIKLHPLVGDRIISGIEFLNRAELIVRHHHERYDGKGYPNGLPNENTDLLARIVILTDAFDAMTGNRPYRDMMMTNKAITIIKENSGTQFDPALVDVFLDKKIYLMDFPGEQ